MVQTLRDSTIKMDNILDADRRENKFQIHKFYDIKACQILWLPLSLQYYE